VTAPVEVGTGPCCFCGRTASPGAPPPARPLSLQPSCGPLPQPPSWPGVLLPARVAVCVCALQLPGAAFSPPVFSVPRPPARTYRAWPCPQPYRLPTLGAENLILLAAPAQLASSVIPPRIQRDNRGLSQTVNSSEHSRMIGSSSKCDQGFSGRRLTNEHLSGVPSQGLVLGSGNYAVLLGRSD